MITRLYQPGDEIIIFMPAGQGSIVKAKVTKISTSGQLTAVSKAGDVSRFTPSGRMIGHPGKWYIPFIDSPEVAQRYLAAHGKTLAREEAARSVFAAAQRLKFNSNDFDNNLDTNLELVRKMIKVLETYKETRQESTSC